MDNKNLIKEFSIISNKRWIKAISNHNNAVGLTFENELNKKPDSLFFPDYYGIEIKCTQRYSRYPIALFSQSLDGPSLYEINRLLTLYGKTDEIFKDRKILMANLKYNEKVIINDKYKFMVTLDDTNKKMYFEVYDLNDKLLEKESYINYDTLKLKLETKLYNLAIVYASKKIDNNIKYFRYYKMQIYKLHSFDKFIELIKNKTIIITILCRVSRSGLEIGRQRNKNIMFSINKKDIDKLFLLEDESDNDKYNDFSFFNI